MVAISYENAEVVDRDPDCSTGIFEHVAHSVHRAERQVSRLLVIFTLLIWTPTLIVWLIRKAVRKAEARKKAQESD
jgi:hypothetical protein